MAIEKDEFESRFGRAPERDDLHRVNCPLAGQLGHWLCGVCVVCGMPRFDCGHMAPSKDGLGSPRVENLGTAVRVN